MSEEFRGIVIDEEGGERWLAIADTHVGLEVELGKKGVRIPSQSARIANSIVEYAESVGATSLAILGDVKHEIGSVVDSMREVKEFLEILSRKFNRVVLVKGNHDGGLDTILTAVNNPNIHLVDSRGFMIRSRDGKKLLLLHGNSKPRIDDFVNADVVIMGHTHPAIAIQDVTGYVMRVPVIVKVKVDKELMGINMYEQKLEVSGSLTMIILPTFNPLTVGMNVLESLTKDLTSVETILHYARTWERPESVEVYLLDMTYLGTLDILMRIKEEVAESGYDLDWL